MTEAGSPDYLAMPLGEFLDALAAREASPSGGAVAAVAVGLAAGLAAMTAEFSTRQMPDAAELAATANELRAGAAPLADEDAVGYAKVLTARSAPGDGAERAERMQDLLRDASQTPLRIAQIGADVVVLACRLEQEGNPNLRGDARTARVLATAAVQAAASLVALNLADPNDPLVQQAVALAESAPDSGC